MQGHHMLGLPRKPCPACASTKKYCGKMAEVRRPRAGADKHDRQAGTPLLAPIFIVAFTFLLADGAKHRTARSYTRGCRGLHRTTGANANEVDAGPINVECCGLWYSRAGISQIALTTGVCFLRSTPAILKFATVSIVSTTYARREGRQTPDSRTPHPLPTELSAPLTKRSTVTNGDVRVRDMDN